jgi:hypothetical protein
VVLVVLPYLELWKVCVIWLLWLRTLLRYFNRVRRSNMGMGNCVLSMFALPLFVALLVRSWMKHRVFHQVTWKGREIRVK